MSNFYDKASLVMIPSGTKEGTIFSLKPTNGDGDFTFSRSTSATRVGPSGYIEKETQNLLTHSGDITNADWSIINAVIYNGTITDPNGGNKAYSYTGNSTNSAIRQTNSLSSGVYTFSVYLKSPTSAPINIRLDSNNGTFENYPCALTTNWQRFEFFYVHNSSSLSAWFGGGLSWTSGEEVHIAFPQLEQGLVARDYIETTTSAVYGGITDNVPRLDYTDSSCPALLLEGQRTNLVPHSEYASGYGTNGTGTTTDNANTSPEGLNNAFQLDDTSTGDYYRIEHYHAFSAGDYTFSVFIKKTTGALSHYSGIQLDVTRKYVIVDTTNGTFTEVTGTTNDNVTIEDFSEDWWRISITNNLTAATHRIAIWPAISENGTSINTNATGSNLYYGLQLEEGYATSYIPTYGTSVTFESDACNSAGNASTFNDSEGVLYAEVAALYDDGTNRVMTISDGTLNNRIAIAYTPTGNQVRGYLQGSSTITLDYIVSNILEFNKIAVKYKSNDISLWVNGVEVGTSTSAFSVSGLSELAFDRGDGNLPLYSKTKQILYFPTALTDEELEALTQV